MSKMESVRDQSGRVLISARDFFSQTKSREDFREWMATRISEYCMRENEDFILFLTADAAKEILMLEKASFERSMKESGV